MTISIRVCSTGSITREGGLYAASIAPPNRFAVMAARLRATNRAITGKTCVNTLERYGHIYASILKKHITLMTSSAGVWRIMGSGAVGPAANINVEFCAAGPAFAGAGGRDCMRSRRHPGLRPGSAAIV